MSILTTTLSHFPSAYSTSLCCRTDLERSLAYAEQLSFHRALGSLEHPIEAGSADWNPKRNGSVSFRIGVVTEERNPQRGDHKWVLCSSSKALGKVHTEGEWKEDMCISDPACQGENPANRITYARLLQGCIDTNALVEGKRVHFRMVESGFVMDVYLRNRLITMYAKCGSLEDACQVFEKMPERNVVSWNAMIAGFAQNGYGDGALALFREMQEEGMKPNRYTFISVLKVCATLGDMEEGRQVHAHSLKGGWESDVSVGNALVTMYAKCGHVDYANAVFSVAKRNLVSWNAMIACYAQNGFGERALKLFCEMQEAGVKADLYTFSGVLGLCASEEALEHGEQVHDHIIKTGFGSSVAVGNALVTMYAKCQRLRRARQVFDKMPKRDVISWNAMIAGYVQNGYGEEVFKLLCRMRVAGMKRSFMLNEFTFASVLRACASLTAIEHGQEFHAHIIKTGFESNVFVGSALVDMYSKCGRIESARQVFDEMPEQNLVSWNSMIAGYVQNGCGEEALDHFRQMQWKVMKPNQFTFASVLRVCASLTASEHGREIHGYVIKNGFELDVFVGSALVDMYAKCESIEAAVQVFDSMPNQNLVSWNAMISGCVQNGHGEEALILFCKMQRACIIPDQFNLASVLGACASLAAFGYGRQVHSHAIKTGLESDVCVGSSLVDMYSKCGNIVDALKVFNETCERDIVLWTVMLAACTQHGLGDETLKLFEQMQLAGMKPDHITILSILSACSLLGLVKKGLQYFHSMSQDYGITPKVEHYACVVDLLGRAGFLHEAKDFIDEMPFDPNAMAWRALLGACRMYGNMELGQHAAENILEMEPKDSSTYVIVSNIFIAGGRQDAAALVQNLMKDKGVKTEPGRSWIEVKSRVHTFVVRDRSHPQTKEIYAKLEELIRQMEEAGYVPNTNLVLHNVEDEQNKKNLCYHSEKLAVAFGLISMPLGAPMQIFKNLRVCSDCHTVIKFTSKIAGREIVLRDSNCFHHFKDGRCSCRDYW